MADRASLKQYLVVDESGKGHLPVRDSPDGPLNHHLMGAAWAALHGGYRGNKYEGPGKEAAIEKLKALYRSEGMELPDGAASEAAIPNFKSQISEGPHTVPDGTGLRPVPDGAGLRPRPDGTGLRPASDGTGLRPASDGTGLRPASDGTGLHPAPDGAGLRFVMTLAEPPGTGLIRIPIAVTGLWKGAEKEFSIGLDDLSEIRENFAKKPTREINVDYEHASEVPFGTGGPVLSAGRIVKLDEPEKFVGVGPNGVRPSEDGRAPLGPTNGKYILYGWFEPTERARELIAAKEYRYISPAIRWGARDKVTGKATGTVLTSVALVNKPFLEELPEIHLCEVEGGMRAFVSLGQLHVPGPVNQESGFGIQNSLSRKEKEMAKTLKLKCLTDEHLVKHGLEPEQKGKIGVFDGEELMGIADGLEGWERKQGNGDGDGQEGKKLAELFAGEIGLPGKSLVDIAALVKRGAEAPQDQFAALSESIHDGRINLLEAGKLADEGRVRFSTILQAQEAERKVEAAVKAGKVLPKNRAHALKLALSDAAGFSALVEQARPVVDLQSRGHAGGSEQPTAQQALMAEVNAYAKENKCSVGVALSEVTKRKPDLWRQYSEEIVAAVEAAQEDE